VSHQMGLATPPHRPLEIALGRFDEAQVVIRDDHVHPREAALLQAAKERRPGRLRFAVAEREPKHLALALLADAEGNQHARRTDRLLPAHLDAERVNDHERIALSVEWTLPPGLDPKVELLAEPAHGALGEARAAELLRNLGHLARGDALQHHLHQSQHKGLLRALIAPEELGRERSVARLRHAQDERAHARGQTPGAVAVAVALPL